jgi:lysophospholipase L1-like esterase
VCNPLQSNLSFPDRTNQQLSKYAAAAKAAAQSKGVGCLDMFALFRKLPADKYHSMLLDGVHPNSNGHSFIFESVKNVLENWEGFKKLR